MARQGAARVRQPREGAGTTNAFRVHDELRAAILAGELRPGARLRTDALARQMATSRTPVREALMLLAREGLVEIEPRRGAVVRSFDHADLLDLYEVRLLLEPHAAQRAATRIEPAALDRLEQLCDLAEARGAGDERAIEDQIAFNDEFHRLIVAAAQSPRVTAALRAVAGIPHGFRTTFWRDAEQREHSLVCHRGVLDALRSRRPQVAEAVMRLHIVAATELLAETVRDEGVQA